jgi:hypothetical protein
VRTLRLSLPLTSQLKTRYLGTCPSSIQVNTDFYSHRASSVVVVISITRAPIPQIVAARAQRVRSVDPDIGRIEREGQPTRYIGTSGGDGLFSPNRRHTAPQAPGQPGTAFAERGRTACLPRPEFSRSCRRADRVRRRSVARTGREHCPHGGEACGPDTSQDRLPSLIALTPESRRHVRALYAYYEERDRPEAARALRNALTAAWPTDRP